MITKNGVKYEVWLSTPGGERLALLDNAMALTAVRSVNNPGYWSVILPASIDKKLLRLDAVVEILRRHEGYPAQEFIAGFLRSRSYSRDTVTIGGPGLVGLLESRIVAYASGLSQADKTDYADDMMKEVIAENLGSSATDTDRDLSAYLSIAADTSDGPSITKSFAWTNVFRALEDIAQAAEQAGTAVYFDIVKTGAGSYEFRTYTGQRGVDNTITTGTNPVIFGLEYGNLEQPFYTENFQNEVNYVYAGGQGEGVAREIVEVEDTTRSGVSIWNRREGFRDARNEDTTAGVTSAGNAELYEGRPRRDFRGNLVENNRSRYGINWNFGDKVTVTFAGLQFDGLVKQVNLSVNSSGEETLIGKVEYKA